MVAPVLKSFQAQVSHRLLPVCCCASASAKIQSIQEATLARAMSWEAAGKEGGLCGGGLDPHTSVNPASFHSILPTVAGRMS